MAGKYKLSFRLNKMILLYFLITCFSGLFGAHIDHETGKLNLSFNTCCCVVSDTTHTSDCKAENLLEHFFENSLLPGNQNFDSNNIVLSHSVKCLIPEYIVVFAVQESNLHFTISVSLSSYFNKAPPIL